MLFYSTYPHTLGLCPTKSLVTVPYTNIIFDPALMRLFWKCKCWDVLDEHTREALCAVAGSYHACTQVYILGHSVHQVLEIRNVVASGPGKTLSRLSGCGQKGFRLDIL